MNTYLKLHENFISRKKFRLDEKRVTIYDFEVNSLSQYLKFFVRIYQL